MLNGWPILCLVLMVTIIVAEAAITRGENR